jgi:hypothetical protein
MPFVATAKISPCTSDRHSRGKTETFRSNIFGSVGTRHHSLMNCHFQPICLLKIRMSPTASFPVIRVTPQKLRLAPSLPDLLCALLLAALFGRLSCWQTLLSDGDTGWHIRTGDYILAHSAVPSHDLFSFSRAGHPWYAWEWLSDVLFARFHAWWGLEGVAALGALSICLTAALLFAWQLRRGAGAWIALAATLAATNTASFHYLARPHLFSLLFLVMGLWLLDEDRRSPTRWLWALVPLAALWANLHAGFVAWLGTLALLVVVSAAQRNLPALRRYGVLAALSSLATLANPYGWQLHRHIVGYLGSQWIVEHVTEFQSPQIRSENMCVFAVLLLGGVAVAARSWRRSQWFEASLVLIWGLAAMRSVRYVPLFAVVAAPVIASYCAGWWRGKAEWSPARSAVRVLWESSQSLGARWRFTMWMPLLAALALAAVLPPAGLADFPANVFPVDSVTHNLNELTSLPAPRILTSDQWADYLIYRLYPQTRVFFDGRSDFYGEAIGDDYRTLMAAGRNSREAMARYGFTLALLPLEWPLGQILERDPDWRVLYRDRQAVLLARKEKQ